MTPPDRLCPSILATDFMRMGEAIEQLAAVGCDYLHMDVMDGHFVPAITLGEKMVADARAMFDGTVDSHLMVSNPAEQIPRLIQAGADPVIFHLEASNHPAELVSTIRQAGVGAGIAVDGPTTDLRVLLSLLDQLEVVLIATGKVGKAGQPMEASCLDKVRQIRQSPGGASINIMVDIGISQATIQQAKQAGANWFAVSSAIFKSPVGIGPAYQQLVEQLVFSN